MRLAGGRLLEGAEPGGGRSLSSVYAPLIYVFILILLLVFPPGSRLGVDVEAVTFYLVLAGVVAGTHLLANYQSNWMRIDTIFLFSFMVVNFQWPAMLLISQITPTDTKLLKLMEFYVTYGTWLSVLGLTGWAIGHALSHRPLALRRYAMPKTGAAVLLQVILLVLFAILAGQDYLSGAQYQEIRENGGASTISGPAAYVLIVLTISGVSLVTANIYRLTYREVAASVPSLSLLFGPAAMVTIAYCVIFLVAGERGHVIQVIVTASIAYFSSVRPLRLPAFALLIGGGSILFSVIGYARAQGYADVGVFFDDFTAWNSTINLANSLVTLYKGIEIIDMRGLYWGQLWVSNILSLIPWAQSAFLNLTGWSTHEINSAYLITYEVFGPNAHTSYGTSLVVDIFMNFGSAGVVFFMAAYGYVCRTFQSYLTGSAGFHQFLVAGAFAGLVLYASRSSLFVQLQTVVWTYIFSLIVYRFVPVRRERTPSNSFDTGRSQSRSPAATTFRRF